MITFQLHFGGRAGCLKAFPNAMGSYHVSVAGEFTADVVENFPQTVVFRFHTVSPGKPFQHHCPARIRVVFAKV
jgi:hypothetical protein